MSTQVWMTQKELAEHLRVSTVTVWRHVRDGKLPAPHKLSYGTARYYGPEVDKYLRGK